MLSKCLQSILNNDYPKTYYEIIVVDNNSTDGTRNVARCYPFVRLVLEISKGAYRARNKGIMLARGEILLFTDSDCVVARNWLRAFDREFEEGVDAVQGTSNLSFEQGIWARLECVRSKLYGAQQVDTKNFAVRREIFHDIGLFDEDMENGADTEFGMRLHRNAKVLKRSANPKLFHQWPRELRKLIFKMRAYANGDCLLYRRHAFWSPAGKAIKTLALPYTVLKQTLLAKELNSLEKILYILYKVVCSLMREYYFYSKIYRY